MKLPNFTVKFATVLCCAVLLAAWLFASGAAQAATLQAANNGVDSATCGAAANPCRSISKTIAHAAAGDTILVGPGLYGDLNADGNFEPVFGEEAAEVGFGCDCMIKVDKPLTIISADGADATVLDAGASTVAGVRILTSGVTFGQQRRGFTIWRAGDAGLIVDAKGSQVKIGGNVAKFNSINCRFGCFDPPGPRPGFDIAGDNNEISSNHSANNFGSGFKAAGNGHRFSGNLATENGGAGYFVLGTNHTFSRNIANNSGGSGFALDGANFTLTGNAAAASGSGFLVHGTTHTLRGNVATGNIGFGFEVSAVKSPSGTTLTRNAARGNAEGGVLLVVDATVVNNNMYGNNEGTSATYSLTNCGLVNDTGGAVTATNNFWGATTGPGANPADDVCNTTGSTTTTAPVAASEITVPAFPLF